MSTEGMILTVVLTALSLGWVVTPLVRGRSTHTRSHEAYAKRRERLLVYYERVIINIRDLDEDYATGKLDESEYTTEREDWVQRGIQVLKALDALEADAPNDEPPTDEAVIDREIDTAIEAAVAARRAQQT